jgi:hypothetical protein
VREEDVGPAHRLRPLAVGVAGKDRVDAVFRLRQQRAAEPREVGVELIDGVERPEPQIGGNLVVARAAGVQLAGHGAHFFIEQALDERVHVFVGGTSGRTISETIGDAIEPLLELGFFGGRHDPHAAEGVDPGLARHDVLRPEAVIDGEAAVQRVERLARTQREAPTPHLMDVRLLGHRSARRSIRLQSYSLVHTAG